MKKNYLFGMLALAAMTMVGCSNDEVVNDYSQDNAIQFGTYVGRDASSRATVITTKELGEQGFGVFAYYTGNQTFEEVKATATPNFMYNQMVTKATDATYANNAYSAWEYAPVKYWPNNTGDKVSFFAYAPYISEDSEVDFKLNATTGYPSISYEVETTEIENEKIAVSENQVDLLYLSSPHLDKQKQYINNKVEFQFGHALSRIGFAAKVLVDEVNEDPTGDINDDPHNLKSLTKGTIITINSVKLTGEFYNKGTLNLYRPAVTDANFTTGWTNQTADGSFSWLLSTANFETDENIFEGDKIATGTLKDNGDGTKIWEDGLLNNASSYLMIMPQAFTQDNQKQICVTVDYNVVTTDENNSSNNSDIKNVITSVPFNFTFEEGKAYVFVLHLGMTSVKLSAAVTEWADGFDWSVNVPVNGDGKLNQDEWNDYYPKQ